MKGILIAGSVSTLLSFILTPIFIKVFAKRGYGQVIRDDGPTSHHVKRGTPTMGGIVLLFSALIGYFASHLINGVSISASALLLIGSKLLSNDHLGLLVGKNYLVKESLRQSLVFLEFISRMLLS